MTKDVLLFVDGGADDAALLLVLLGTPDVNIRGIVCSFGNISADKCANVMGQILTLAGREDIPLVMGAKHPHSYDWRPMGDGAYGEDGINGVQFENKTTPVNDFTHHFVLAQMAQAQAEGRKLNLIVSSPLTALAEAMQIESYKSIGRSIEAAYIFAGCFDGVQRLKECQSFEHPPVYNSPADPALFHTEYGNITPQAEFNAYMDPEALMMVSGELRLAGVPTYYMGLDAVNGPEIKAASGFVMTEERLTKAAEALPHGYEMAQILATAAHLDVRKLGAEGALVYDPHLALLMQHGAALFPIKAGHVTIERKGEGRGRTHADFTRARSGGAQYIVGHNPNPDYLLDLMLKPMAKALTRRL